MRPPGISASNFYVQWIKSGMVGTLHSVSRFRYNTGVTTQVCVKPAELVPSPTHVRLVAVRLTPYDAVDWAICTPFAVSSGSKMTRIRACRTSATRRKVASE